MTVININIDELSCTRFERCISNNKEYRALNGHLSRHLFKHPGYRSCGFRPENLFDWRAIESRRHQLAIVRDAFSTKYWNTLKSLSKKGKEAGGDGTVWVPDLNHEHIDVFDGRWLRSAAFNELFDHAIPRPGFRPVVMAGDDLLKMKRLKERRHTWTRRCGSYGLAFKMSIEERLESFIEANLREECNGYNRFTPCTFTFENEGRSYLITTDDSSRVTWHEGNIYVDTKAR